MRSGRGAQEKILAIGPQFHHWNKCTVTAYKYKKLSHIEYFLAVTMHKAAPRTPPIKFSDDDFIKISSMYWFPRDSWRIAKSISASKPVKIQRLGGINK